MLNVIPENTKNYQRLVASGTIFFFMAMLLSGPCPGLPDAVWMICIGILIGGIGGALINNNVVPSLSQIIGRKYPNQGRRFKDKLTNIVSSINTGFFGLGSIIGPICASVLSDVLSFRLSFTIISAFVLVVVII